MEEESRVRRIIREEKERMGSKSFCNDGLEGLLGGAAKNLADAARGYDEHRDEDMLQELMDAALEYAEVSRKVKAELTKAD